MREDIMSKISNDIFKKLINEMNDKILPTTIMTLLLLLLDISQI